MQTPVRINPKIKAAAILLGVAALVALWYGLYAATGFMPRCVFRVVTGLKCPGCGSQTFLLELLHGHWLEAFRANPSIPVYILYLAAITQPFSSRLRERLTTPAALWILLASIILWTVARNVAGI